MSIISFPTLNPRNYE